MYSLKDIYHAGYYFFGEPSYASKRVSDFRERQPSRVIGICVRGLWLKISDIVLVKAKERLSSLESWDAKTIAETLKVVGNEVSQPSKVVMQVLRYALTGLESGFGVPVVIEILGRDIVTSRLEICQTLQQSQEGPDPDTHAGDIQSTFR